MSASDAFALVLPVLNWGILSLSILIIAGYFANVLGLLWAGRTPRERQVGQILVMPFAFVVAVGALCLVLAGLLAP